MSPPMPPRTEHTFPAGQRVRLRGSPASIGVLTGRERERAGLLRLQVEFPEGTRWVPVDQLEPAATVREHPTDLLQSGRLAGAIDLRRTLTHRRLSGRLADVIYSMEATNTDFYPYQFKPVLKLLASPTSGLLIADEVGLGKTIEAGLVWTELRSRFDLRRLLVLCPAALREKWRFELRDKFGVQARIEDAAGLLDTLREEATSRHGFAVVASLQGLRPPRGWDAEEDEVEEAPTGARVDLARYLKQHAYLDPLVDLLVIDEAHHLRNAETVTHRLGQLVRGVAQFRVLLTATPVHNRSDDLFSVLGLLDPDTFQRREDLAEILAANEPLVRARDRLLAGAMTVDGLSAACREAGNHRLLQGNRQLRALLADIPTPEELERPETRSRIAHRLEHVNLLAHAVTRTRKRNVTELRVVREPVAHMVPMTEVETDFYEGVTALIRQYASTRDINDMFLLAQPQRQLSSCMAAALDVWTQRKVALDEVELAEGRDAEELGLGPLATFLAQEAPLLATVEELEAEDTKFEELERRLCDYLDERPLEKVVVFSSFRATLAYLERRLGEAGLSTIVLVGGQRGRGTGPTKTQVVEAFAEPDGPSILLSSEVGGEGLDLQFSRVVVNYDLPWNPMRVEQRIGRLDRIGQEADKILVWNLLHEGTIDERLYTRLYEKLDLCRRALGDFEAVLGEQMRELENDLLGRSLSPEQQEQRIAQTALALANLQREQEELENQAQHLVAYGDYILNQVRAAHELNRWISEEDVRRYVLDFFRGRYKGCEFQRVAQDSPDFDVRLSRDARREVDDFIREKGLEPTRLTDIRSGVVRSRFSAKARSRQRGRPVELISQFHPLARFVSEQIRQTEEQLTPAVAVRLRAVDLPGGTWVAVVSFWSIEGLTTTERLVYAASRDGETVAAELAERLVLAAAYGGEDWIEARAELDLDAATLEAERLFDDLARRFRRHVGEVRAENEDRADIQGRNLERHLRTQLATLQGVRGRHLARGRTALVKATEGRISALKERVDRQRQRIEERRRIQEQDDDILVVVVRVEGLDGTEAEHGAE